MNAKISVLVICVKAIIYLLLYNLHSCTFKKQTQVQVLSCEFCEIFKDTFFTEHLRTTASNKILILNFFVSEFRNFQLKTEKMSV